MWYTIKEGKHRASPLSLGIHTGRNEASYEVIFDESCRYILEGEDQLDWNKLVGWSYGLHHQNSIRIGWRYNPDKDLIELASYVYESGIRKDVYIADVELGKKSNICIYFHKGYLAMIVDEFYYYDQDISMSPTWGYNLGLYFGGNEAAPHDMKVWLRKLN